MNNKVCAYCGKPQKYAKDLCKVCYNRLRRTGSIERKEVVLKRKKVIPLTKEQIEKALHTIYEFQKIIIKNKIMTRDNVWRHKNGKYTRPNFKTLKKCFDFLGLDIFEELNISSKYKDIKKYKNYLNGSDSNEQ